MKIFKLTKDFSVVCNSEGTRYGFRHLASLCRDGAEVCKAKACYYNRTWESYTFQSVLHDVINKYFDKKTGLLRRIGYHWDIKDYKEVDGVLIPHSVVAARKGGSCTYEFQEVIHDIPIPDAMFSSSRWFLE